MMENFDLVIIGAGPGGYNLAAKAAEKGMKVAVVEQSDNIGGTCLNKGCIPTKALLASALQFRNLKRSNEFGLNTGEVAFNWNRIQERKENIVFQLNQNVFKLMKSKGICIFNGSGKIIKGKIVKISNGEELSADKICICSGSIPAVPSFIPKNRNLFWTSDEALTAKSIPESLLIVGGGVIGLELGQVFNEFGSKVCIVEMASQILPNLDSAVAKRLVPIFKKSGMEILTGKKVESLKEFDEEHVSAVIDGEERKFSRALICVGRRANLGFLEESTCNIETEKGFIKINEYYETSEPDVFAIGDCVKGPMLAHKAVYDAEMLLSQWFNDKRNYLPDYEFVPSCVYTYPEIAWVGFSEEELKKRNISYKLGRSMFSANGKALTAGDSEGQIKLMFSSDNKLLGAVIWGTEASVLIHEAVVLANMGIDCSDFNKIIHAHPTLSETLSEAIKSAIGL